MGAFKHRAILPGALGLALLLAACNGTAPSQTPPSTPASASPSAAATGAAAPSTAPSGAAASATATPSTTPVATAILHGTVYDDYNQLAPDGTTVTAHSLDPAHPFDSTITAVGGNYSFPNAPINTQIQLTATHPKWTSRSRVVVALQNDSNNQDLNVYNFGGTATTNDAAGPAYFLSAHPEIESVTPVDQSTEQPNDQMAFKMVLSEPLDDANRRRLAAAFTIIPNNASALGDSQGLPAAYATSGALAGLYSGATPPKTAVYSYRENSGFLNGFALSNFTWSPDGTTATFSLNAPVKTGNSTDGQYAFLLVSQDKTPITDADGNQFGMSSKGTWDAYASGDLIRNAVKETEVTFPAGAQITGTDKYAEEQRWIDTHETFTTFSVARQTVAPKLVSVLARRNYTAGSGQAVDRVELTFSEPMMAYPSITGDQVLSLNNYILSAAPTLDELNARNLGSTAPTLIKGGESSTTVQSAMESGVGMALDSEGSQLNGTNSPYTIAISATDPRVVVLTLDTNSLPLDANYIKVYAGSDTYASSSTGKSVADPAGNPVSASGTAQVGAIQ